MEVTRPRHLFNIKVSMILDYFLSFHNVLTASRLAENYCDLNDQLTPNVRNSG